MLESSHNARLKLERFQKFITLANEIRVLAGTMGRLIIPIYKTDDPNFLKISVEQQQKVVSRLETYRDILVMAQKDGGYNEKRLLWHALKRLGFIPPNDAMDLFTEGDYVEIIVGDIQIYRSFNYYDCVSYSLDELETIPWQGLFYRPPELQEALIKEAIELFTTRQILQSKVPEHHVIEIDSPFSNIISYQLKYLVPLRDKEHNRPDCGMTIVKAGLVKTVDDSKKNELVLEYLRRGRVMQA